MTKIKVTEESSVGGTEEAAEKIKESGERQEAPDWETRLQEKEKEARENYDRYLRLSAELENYKKRMEKEKSDLYKFANENIVKDLLPVLDNLERALEHGREEETSKALIEGVELTHKSLWTVLEKHGLSRIEALGETFDPNHHEAVMVQEDGQRPDGEVISQMQLGYRLHNRLIRPAMVVVSKKPELNPEVDPEE
ncbi:MAG: nucleotide exchange factor GrpE [Thermodesulfobacteriota bacterium]